MKFYLGTDRTTWLWTMTDMPLFVSHRTLRRRRTPFPRATTNWALDSGGFTELSLHGTWVTTASEYVDAVRRYHQQLGSLDWASPQDWMCEPWMIEKTGLTVERHQLLTVENYLELKALGPELPFIPVLQGWELEDYHRHIAWYEEAGVDLRALPLVGVGSVCRRQGTGQIATIFESLRAAGLPAMHGFGVKTQGLGVYGPILSSADSMAWSFAARMDAQKGITRPGCRHRSCNHCPEYALAWRDRALARIA